MKFSKILFTGLFLLFSLSLSAQYNTLSEWYVGPSAGASASTMTLVPKYVDKMYSLGKNGGLTLRYISENHFGFQLECNYMETGWMEDYFGQKNAANYSYRRRMNFVEVPFLMHAYTAIGAARFFLNIGPKFSYLLSESEVDRSPVTYPQIGKLVERPFQYGVLGGGGFEVHLGPTVLGLEGRYCYNLSNIFNDAIGEDFVTSDLQVITLNLYLLFQLSGNK
jgi:hypothetical protein